MVYVYLGLASVALTSAAALGWYAHYKLGTTVERIEKIFKD